jgi:hypothetical protein
MVQDAALEGRRLTFGHRRSAALLQAQEVVSAVEQARRRSGREAYLEGGSFDVEGLSALNARIEPHINRTAAPAVAQLFGGEEGGRMQWGVGRGD